MYKGTSQGLQKAAGKISLADVAAKVAETLPERQSLYDQRQNMIRALAGIEAQIKAAGTKAEKKALGVRKLDLQNELKAFKARHKGQQKLTPPCDQATFEQAFIDVAREMLGGPMYRALISEALKRCNAPMIYDIHGRRVPNPKFKAAE